MTPPLPARVPPFAAKFALLLAGTALALAGCGGAGDSAPAGAATVMAKMSAAAQLGESIFKDPSLSEPGGMACATCHQPDRAHATNDVVPAGVVAGRSGIRNAPSLQYLKFSPDFSYGDDGPVGGFFRDGRARTFTDQAQRPFLNPNEMNNPDVATLLGKVAAAPYAAEFERVWGAGIFADPVGAFNKLATSLAAYQREDEDFAPFSSKFDLWRAGKVSLTGRELQGFALYNDPVKGNCAACHPSTGPDSKTPPLFTDFTYDNLGLPRNAAIPANSDPAFVDLGLCGPARTDVSDPTLCGAFKVPTLRNIAITAPYFHNGVMPALRDAVRFYNQRDTHPELFYPIVGGEVQKFDDLPGQYKANVNITEVPYNRKPGDSPTLTDEEVDLIVEFLSTLTDGYPP